MSVLLKKDRLISINPATLEAVGEVKTTPPGNVNRIVERAREGFCIWKGTGLSERAKRLKRAQRLMLDRSEMLAECITMEMGRPFAESLAVEVEASIDLVGYYAERADKFLNDRGVPLHNIFFIRRGSKIQFQPLGVMGIIAPWNWSLLIPLGGIVPALLAGNSVVFKPSELAPIVGQRIRDCFLDAEIPEEVFQVIQGDGHVGAALVKSGVDKLFFTGSTKVGQKVMETASRSLKPVVLEMGGSDPAIVCEDADIDIAASGILWGGFNNCGQNCNSVERVCVHKKNYETFMEKLLDKVSRLRLGNGMNPDTDMGPLASKAQFHKMEQLIHRAVHEGAVVRCGGKAVEGEKGYFYQPTVLTTEKPIESFYGEEWFGPAVVVTPVRNDEEAVVFANHSAFGLAASVWTKDRQRGMGIARRLESGSVMINDVIVSFGMTEAGWTGIKKSGIGWVHGEKGLDEMVNIQYVNYDPQYKLQKFWWFPYSESMISGMKAGMDFLFHGSLIRRIASLPRVIQHFSGYLLKNSSRKNKL